MLFLHVKSTTTFSVNHELLVFGLFGEVYAPKFYITNDQEPRRENLFDINDDNNSNKDNNNVVNDSFPRVPVSNVKAHCVAVQLLLIIELLLLSVKHGFS